MYIKAFEGDLSCRGFKFAVGATFHLGNADPLKLCSNGFHFCKKIDDTVSYYLVNGKKRYCEVEPIGDVIDGEDNLCCRELRVVRELSFDDLVGLDDNVKWCYRFACHVSGADISRLQDVVIASGGAYMCYLFAREVSGSDISRLQDALIASGNAYWCYRFARKVDGANISRLQDAVIASGDAGWCYWFARYISGSNISRLQEVFEPEGYSI